MNFEDFNNPIDASKYLHFITNNHYSFAQGSFVSAECPPRHSAPSRTLRLLVTYASVISYQR
jgi:hypothetical protein